MVDSFMTVAQQVLVLFILIGVGVVGGKCQLFGREAVAGMTEIVLLFATPCVIIQSFQRPFDKNMLGGLGAAALAAVLVHAVAIGIATLVFRDENEARRRVLRFGVVFSNAGYMSLPLQEALLGEDGVFYGAVYVAVFNLVLWSYGLILMSGGEGRLSPRKLLLNPGVIGLTAGLIIFFFSIPLPEWVSAPIRHLAALNTPLPMLVIGYHLAGANISAALRDRRGAVAIALRLAVIPLLTLGGMALCGVRGTLLVACVIAASAPMAAATTMFATKYRQDTALSVNLVSLSTVLSMLTMPLVVGLAQSL